jgi:hypothetical protein
LETFFYEDYPLLLQREYRFLQKKYKLKPINIAPHFLRMRPANFPTIRLAQLAMLIAQSKHLFSIIAETDELDKVKELLNATPNDYWHYHYRFDEAAPYKPKSLGATMVDNIVINTIVPIVFAYGMHVNSEAFKEKAIRWLSETPAEQNSIIKQWKQFGVSSSNAMESQSLLQLKNVYCTQRRCLDCTVANKLLSTNTAFQIKEPALHSRL